MVEELKSESTTTPRETKKSKSNLLTPSSNSHQNEENNEKLTPITESKKFASSL